MIRVNLNVLLAERSLTASKVSKDTGISKTTLSSLVNNTGKGIQYDTLDTLCNYLNVTPNDFFDFIPFDYSLSFYLNEVNIKLEENYEARNSIINDLYKFELHICTTVDERKKKFQLLGELEYRGVNHIKSKENYLISLNFIDDDVEDFKKSFYDKMSEGHKASFNKDVKNIISINFYRSVRKNATSYDFEGNIIPENEDDEVTSSDIFMNITDINVITDWNYSFHI